MVEYMCQRCGYKAYHKGNFMNHLKRKKPCPPLESDISIDFIKQYYGLEVPPSSSEMPPKSSKSPHDENNKFTPKPSKIKHFFLQKSAKTLQNKRFISKCSYCSKEFTRPDNLKRHYDRCKIKKDKDKDKKLEKENEELREVIEKLLIENKKISAINNTTINNNTTNNNNCTNDNRVVNIHINNYGQENTKYITKEYLQELIEKPFQAIPELIKFTHFNKDHPENHNIKITNKKDTFVKVLKNDKWELADRKDTITDLIDKKHSELNSIDMSEKKIHIISRIEAFNKKYIEDDKDMVNKLYKDSELILLNNS